MASYTRVNAGGRIRHAAFGMFGAVDVYAGNRVDILWPRRADFSGTIYKEVSAAFAVSASHLKNCSMREVSTPMLSIHRCRDPEFVLAVRQRHDIDPLRWLFFRWQAFSPRKILQWWTEYRLEQSRFYLVDHARKRWLRSKVSRTPLREVVHDPKCMIVNY